MIFPDWFADAQVLAGIKLDKEAAMILYDRGASIYDAVLVLVNRVR